MYFYRGLVKILIVYLALYCAIWLHELGHALFYYGYGCKPELFSLHVPFYFAGASPGQIDQSCLDSLTRYQIIWASMGGILENILAAALIYLVLTRLKKYSWIVLFGNFFILSDLTEAASYLILNNIIPMGDLVPVVQYFPVLRILLGISGIGILIVIIRFIRSFPRHDRIVMTVFCLVTAICMFGLRFFFE